VGKTFADIDSDLRATHAELHGAGEPPPAYPVYHEAPSEPIAAAELPPETPAPVAPKPAPRPRAKRAAATAGKPPAAPAKPRARKKAEPKA
jgi:hypothetical protein